MTGGPPGLHIYRHLRRGIELGFLDGWPLVYDGTEPVAIDAQAAKGKLTRFLGVNLVSPRTAHMTKIVMDPKDGELAWVSWKTLERQGYRVRFINPNKIHGYPSESYNINTRVIETAQLDFCHSCGVAEGVGPGRWQAEARFCSGASAW